MKSIGNNVKAINNRCFDQDEIGSIHWSKGDTGYIAGVVTYDRGDSPTVLVQLDHRDSWEEFPASEIWENFEAIS